MKVHFEGLARITAEDKNAGVIMMMVLPKFEERSVRINISDISKATGIARPNLQRSLKWLLEEKYLGVDHEVQGFFYISNRLVYSNIHNSINTAKVVAFPSLKAVGPTRRRMQAVEAMNEMSDEDIADAI